MCCAFKQKGLRFRLTQTHGSPSPMVHLTRCIEDDEHLTIMNLAAKTANSLLLSVGWKPEDLSPLTKFHNSSG